MPACRRWDEVHVFSPIEAVVRLSGTRSELDIEDQSNADIKVRGSFFRPADVLISVSGGRRIADGP
ncbi:MAG: hypothetical protein ABS57_05445 [Mesorhizobium sp. SCN 65-12]|nr:MAG: hypothetical protein ABS57_05445 [Mesorhizobium sp. SCN 65-12]